MSKEQIPASYNDEAYFIELHYNTSPHKTNADKNSGHIKHALGSHKKDTEPGINVTSLPRYLMPGLRLLCDFNVANESCGI